jgi:predicted acetyltransferase
MGNKLMMMFVGADIIFAMCGGLIIGFSLMSERSLHATPTIATVAEHLLLKQCPLTGMPYQNHASPSSLLSQDIH